MNEENVNQEQFLSMTITNKRGHFKVIMTPSLTNQDRFVVTVNGRQERNFKHPSHEFTLLEFRDYFYKALKQLKG